ncbi:MAG: ABC transporter permease [Actinomycetota bacterium]|nr:ABC transporter permease [Actinomycetota bacterium]
MIRYLIRRILFLILVLWIVSGLTFLIFVKLPPGDPARRAAGRTSTPQTIHAARIALGLDKPVWVQYLRFAKGLIPWPGFFLNKQVYFSWSDFVPVKENIYSKLPVDITLTIGAAAVWLIMGIPIGVVSAIRRRSIFDRSGMIFALLGVSLPVFWLAYVFLYIFWFKLHLVPGSGIPQGMSVLRGALHGSFVLPWVVLSLAFAAFYARMTRANLIETMSEDYIRTARAKGLSERRVIFKHGLRSALTPIVTMFGMDIGVLLGGAVITETVFNLDGIARYAIQSIRRNDFPAVMGVTVFASFFIVVANLIVDIVYAFLDPRVRYS